MTDEHSEQLDGDVLGERVGDAGLPGLGNYPPEQPLGVNDPNLVASDDVAMREARTRSEATPPADVGTRDLLPPDGEDGTSDGEQQMLADEGTADPDTPATPAEVDALHETGEKSPGSER